MAIPEKHKQTVQFLTDFASKPRRNNPLAGGLSVLECKDKSSGKPVFVIAAFEPAIGRPGMNFTIIAKLFDGDPFEEVEVPE